MNIEERKIYARKIFRESLTQVISSFAKNNMSLESLSPAAIEELIQKVTGDIGFLEDRIAQLKNTRVPNEVVLQTYESMLESRVSVLNWLTENNANQQLKAS